MGGVSYLSAWIYFVLAFIFLYLVDKSSSDAKQKKYGQIAFWIIYLFAFFRYFIGNDYPTYWNVVTDPSYNREEYEFLSGAIIKFVYRIQFPPLVFVVFSTISLFCYRKVLSKYSTCQAISWFFYFTFPLLFFQDCSTIRQSAAMGFFFLTFYYLDLKKYIPAILCIILSFSFHRSGLAAMFLLLLPVINKVDRKWNIIFLVFSFFTGKIVERLIIYYLASWGIADRFLYYVDLEMGGFNVFQYLLYGINILNLLFYKKLIRIKPGNCLYITLVNFGLCFFNVFQFESQTAMRLAAFFLLFELLVIPDFRYILTRFTKSLKTSSLLMLFVMFLIQIAMVFIYIKAYNNKVLDYPVYVPYRTWLFYI